MAKEKIILKLPFDRQMQLQPSLGTGLHRSGQLQNLAQTPGRSRPVAPATSK